MKRLLSWSPALLALLLLSPGVVDGASSDEWTRLGGPGGSGVSSATGLPVAFSDTENVAWKTPIPGRGHSSPIAWDDQLFLTTAVRLDEVPGHEPVKHFINGQEFLHPDSTDGTFRHEYRVLGLDAASGDIRWNTVVNAGLPHDNRHAASSYASPTPVTDGERVYAWFGSAGLHALDFAGELLWSADLGPVATLGMGVGTSPVLHDDLVILQVDRELGEGSELVAVGAGSGDIAWRTPRGVQSSWTTPTLVQFEGRTELVTTGNELLISYDPETGRELWRMEGLASNAIHRPLPAGDLVIHTAGYPSKVVKAVRLGGEGDLTGTDHLAWSYSKGTAYVPSNLVYEGILYLVADNGVMTALDANTGAVIYEGGRPPIPQRYVSSPVAYDGKILLAGEDGEVLVLRAGPEYEVLSVNSMGEKIWAMPSIANDRIYLRGLEHLWAIGGTSE